MPTSNQVPSEVKKVTYDLEISPSCSSPGKLHKQGEMPKTIKGTSSAGESGSQFHGGPNSRKGKR